MQQLRVRWQETRFHNNAPRTSTYYGTIVGYIRDFHNRPCAVVLVEDNLLEVGLGDLTVLSEEKFQEELNDQ